MQRGPEDAPDVIALLANTAVASVYSSWRCHDVTLGCGDGADRSRRVTQSDDSQSTRLLASIVASSNDAVIGKDLTGRITSWNAAAERTFGYTADEVIGTSILRLIPADRKDEEARILEVVARGDSVRHFETVRVRKDGSTVDVSVTISPIRNEAGDVVGASKIARDISPELQMREELRRSEIRFRRVFEAAQYGIMILEGDTGLVADANPLLLSMLGLARAELVGTLIWETGFFKEVIADFASFTDIKAQGCVRRESLPIVTRDGRRLDVEFISNVYPVASGEQVQFNVRDVTGAFRTAREVRQLNAQLEEKTQQLEAAVAAMRTDVERQRAAADALRVTMSTLAASEKRFGGIFNAELVGFGISEMASGRILEINQHCADFFGYARDEMIGSTIFDLDIWADPADRASILARDATYRGPREAAFRRKSGEIRHALCSLEPTPTVDGSEDVLLFILVDLTERKRLEAQLMQSQKMEAVGRLAGGVAHDFNNSLGVILGYTELLMRNAAGPELARLGQILKATTRATGLTRQLLAFSRKQIIDPKVVDINALLADLVTMLGRLLGEDIAVTVLPGVSLGRVKVDAGQFEQVVINLCVNARDAMPEGGSLRLETGNIDLDAAQATRYDAPAPGPYVRLTVTDSGTGIEQGILSKIFEPFFTTKAEGKGTGLGLAMVYGVVKQAGGAVSVYSEVGQGTAFSVYLPRTGERESAAPVVAGGILPGGWQTILLVEDDESLRAIALELLAEHGYNVLDASSSVGAVELARAHDGPIHLLLTDVVLPGANGRGLAELLCAERPSLKVLYMSGYTDDVLSHRGVIGAGSALLQKPFSAVALIRRVRALLEESKPGVQSS